MAMKCPKCGSEISPDEAFCGQCGTPTTILGQLAEMTQSTQSAPLNTNRDGQNRPSMLRPPQPFHRSGQLPSQDAYSTTPILSTQNGQATPNQSAVESQPTSFYQEPTEAMSAHQAAPGQSFVPGYPGSVPVQSFQAGNFPPPGPGYAPTPPFPSAQMPVGFGMQPEMTPPPKKRSDNSLLIVAIIFLVLALVAVSILGTIYVLNGQSPPKAAATPTSIPTATTAPSPTATPPPTPSPSPTIAPTPTPFAGFAWCGTQCTSNGFAVQYPQGWNGQQTTDTPGTEFLNPTAPDEYAAFMAPGATSSTADALVANDLQTNFAAKPGYTQPTPTQTTTIGGVTWVYQTATYTYQTNQMNNQPEQVNVYATIYQGKGYIIELEASVSQFSAVNTQYFATIIGSFEFAQSAS